MKIEGALIAKRDCHKVLLRAIANNDYFLIETLLIKGYVFYISNRDEERLFYSNP